MDWKILIPLAIACILVHYGIGFILYCALGAICFLFGFFCSLDKDTYPRLLPKRKCAVSKGIPAVISIMEHRGVCIANNKMSKNDALDIVLNQMITYTIRDYVDYWYKPITPDDVFLKELHRLLQNVIGNTIKLTSRVNWVAFVTGTLPSLMASHIRLYRNVIDKKSTFTDKAELLKVFFDCETEQEKTICRECICVCRNAEQDYLRRLTDLFLFFVMPEEEYRVPAVRYIAREVLVAAVFLPTIDLLSDPDFINRSVAWFAKDSGAFTVEYFIQALEISDSKEELKVVMEQVSAYMERLRGHDTEEHINADIKDQLSNLSDLLKLCTRRSRELENWKSGNIPQTDNLKPGVQSHGPDPPPDERYTIPQLYASCVNFRKKAQSLLEENQQNTATTEEQDESSVFGEKVDEQHRDDFISSGVTVEGFVDLVDTDLRTPFDDEEEEDECEQADSVVGSDFQLTNSNDNTAPNPTDSDSDKTMGSNEDLLAFGVDICGDLLRHLSHDIEPMVHRILRKLSTSSGSPDPHLFDAVQEKLTVLMLNKLPKDDPEYTQFLIDLGVFEDANIVENETIDSSTVQQTLGTPDTTLETTVPSNSSATTTTATTFKFDGIASFINAFKFSESKTLDSTHVADKQDQAVSNVSSSASSQVNPPADLYTAEITRSELMGDTLYYTIRVSRTSATTGKTECWHTLRRFTHFDQLHNLIVDRYYAIPKLKLPPKMFLGALSRRLQAKRLKDLEEYLTVLCDPNLTSTYPDLLLYLVEFLQPTKWDSKKFETSMMGSFLKPLRTVGKKIKAAPDMFVDGITQIIMGPQQPFPNNENESQWITIRPSLSYANVETDPTSVNDSPIRMLFHLVDEIFDLQRKTSLSRESNFLVLRTIFRTFFGPRVNKKIIAKATELTSVDKMTEYMVYLRDFMWPHVDPSHPKVPPPAERTPETKLRTRILCRTMLLGSVLEELVQYLGHELTRRGLHHLFRVLQEDSLNRRFIYSLLEAFIYHLFPSQHAQWESIIEEQLCPVKTDRPCHTHSKAAST